VGESRLLFCESIELAYVCKKGRCRAKAGAVWRPSSQTVSREVAGSNLRRIAHFLTHSITQARIFITGQSIFYSGMGICKTNLHISFIWFIISEQNLLWETDLWYLPKGLFTHTVIFVSCDMARQIGLVLIWSLYTKITIRINRPTYKIIIGLRCSEAGF
jgi:hypothetical protein